MGIIGLYSVQIGNDETSRHGPGTEVEVLHYLLGSEPEVLLRD